MATGSALSNKILKQVEFYFSDSNYPRDKFLRAQAAQNEEGFVPINVIATFSRVKSLTEDIKLISEAARKSPSLVLNEDGTMIKRKNPLPEEDTSLARTVYTKGWTPGISIEEIEDAVTPYGKVLCVRIRKFLDKKPKDSAFIEFETDEVAKKVCNES